MNTFPSKLNQPKARRTQEGSILQGRLLNKNTVDRIINLKDEMGCKLLEKFSIESILANIEKHQIQIVELFSKYLRDGFNLLQFIRFFLNIIPHHYIENLYLAMGLIDLFRAITVETHKERVVLKDITDYMCDKIIKNGRAFNTISAKFIPFSKFFSPNQQTKQFLQLPPSVFGESDQNIYKLSSKCIKTDSAKHSRAIVKYISLDVRSQFCYDLKKIFILDSLSDSISVYDENCSLVKKISPSLNKLKKQVIILSFAFSKRQFRVGAVLKDFSIKFWDHFNNFQYEKSISTTSICQNLQTNIYFLEYFNCWITTDKTGTINFWNLLEEKPDRKMKCKYNAHINDVCEIPALNLLVVVQECKRNSRLLIETQDKNLEGNSEASVVLYNFYNGNIITQIDLQGMRIPHTLIYSEIYQVLFMSGLQKKIKIYDLHPIYMDASLKGQLIGHQNLITCFSLISDTPMLVSADDKGKVKLWDFRNYMCLQTIDFSDKTVITNLLDMVDIGKLGVFGSRVNYIQFEDKHTIMKKRNQQQNLKVESIDFDTSTMQMYVFSGKALRVIDLHRGQIKSIFSFKQLSSEQEFTSFRYFANQKKFVLGSSNGEVHLYSSITGQLDSTLKDHHEGAISEIEFDQANKLYITVGYDSKILIHRASDGSMVREIKNNFLGKEINAVQISVYHNMMAISSNSSSSLYLWNYEFGKLIGQIEFHNEIPIVLHFINGYALLVVGTNQGNIYLFRTNLTCFGLEIELIEQTSISKNILNIYTDAELVGNGKKTICQKCTLLVFCSEGQIVKYDFHKFIQKEQFKGHCREKSNYNPYREGKENFASQLQKLKHTIVSLPIPKVASEDYQNPFQQPDTLCTELTSTNLSKLLRLEHSYNVVVGNEQRIKIWNQSHELLCDLNIHYCLPYKWNLKPTSRTMATQKIYYGIKVMQTITKKYQNDVSIGEAKNLEMKQLINFLEADHAENSLNRLKMMTEPDELQSSKSNKDLLKPVVLLQNEYSRKDLNFQLVKRFNFTQVAGPTLKELDNIKKIQSLQRDWKIKEERQEKEKQFLMKSIQTKAKKNEEKDYIQLLFVKPKKIFPKEVKLEGQQIEKLTKKLNCIENKQQEEKKTHLTTFYKSIYNNRFPNKTAQGEIKSFSEKKVQSHHHSQSRIKQSFEDYYKTKHSNELKGEFWGKGKENSINFRDILTEMNGRVNTVKKYRYKRKQSQEKNEL